MQPPNNAVEFARLAYLAAVDAEMKRRFEAVLAGHRIERIKPAPGPELSLMRDITISVPLISGAVIASHRDDGPRLEWEFSVLRGIELCDWHQQSLAYAANKILIKAITSCEPWAQKVSPLTAPDRSGPRGEDLDPLWTSPLAKRAEETLPFLETLGIQAPQRAELEAHAINDGLV